MEKQMIFHILEIEETMEEEIIRSAYRTLLKKTNPEDDPEGFKRIRQAYEEAMALAAEPRASVGEQKEKTEGDLWIEQVDKVYGDIEQRRRVSRWEALLAAPFCEGLDTSLDARERLLVFLMDHIYLPWEVWKAIDQRFEIENSKEELEEKFPKNFLNYVIHYIENEGFVPYEYFETDLDQDGDAWMRHYLDIKKRMDNGNIEGLGTALDDLSAFGIYHPYQDVERARLELAQDKKEEAKALLTQLMEKYPSDCYILHHGAVCAWSCEDKEEAGSIWSRVVEKMPEHYPANVGLVRYQVDMGQYYEARERLMKLMEHQSQDDEIMELLKTANEHLIEDWTGKVERGEGDEHLAAEALKLELGWCLFQNERLDDAIALLENDQTSEDQRYGYCNLLGRVLYQNKDFGRSLPYLQEWLERIQKTEDNGTEENRKRQSREGRAWHILGGCYHELGRETEAIDAVKQAVETENSMPERLNCSQYLAYLYAQAGEYEHVVDVCDGILKEDEDYYPALLQRQEAFFELHNGQGVIDDYYRSTELFAGFYKPYLLAAQTFFYSNQFEDGKKVFERARENQVVFTNLMRLFEVKYLRNLAETDEDREAAMEICRQLLPLLETEGNDIEDKSEVEYEMALLLRDSDQDEDGMAHLQTAIDQNPERLQYRMVRAQMYLDNKKYDLAQAEYLAAKADYEDAPSFYYGMGMCYEHKGMKVIAREQYEKALELQDGYRDVYERLCNLYEEEYKTHFRKEDFDKAEYYITRQLALRENCYYLVHRGLLYMNALELTAAMEDFEKALTYSSTDWAAYNNLGCCHKYLGDFDKAIELFKKAVECIGEEKTALPYSNMADCYEAKFQYEEAIECYRKDLEWFEYTSFWEEIGDLYTYLQNYEEAFKAYEYTKKRRDYYNNIGDVWYRKGKVSKAVLCHLKGIGKSAAEDKADRWHDLGWLCMDVMRWYGWAAFCFKKAVSMQEDESELLRYEINWAKLYFLSGNQEDARIHGERAMEHFQRSNCGSLEDYVAYKPYRPARLANVGWILICIGREEEGIQYFKDMRSCLRCKQCRSKGCYESHLYLGQYYEAIKDPVRALEEYEKTRELNPTSLSTVTAIKYVQKGMKKS